jgi:uncharacterized membrane protein YphA (DoxX/SURF4 family)
MNRAMFKHVKDWSELNRDVFLDLLRIWLGIALFLKGIAVLGRAHEYAADLSAMSFGPFGHSVVDAAALAHFIGGTMLAFGVLTRLAALIQIPNVVGAILFVHVRNGIFSRDQGFELAMLVLVLLVTFTFVGGGRLSTDWYFSEHPHRLTGEREELLRRDRAEEPISELSTEEELHAEMGAPAREPAHETGNGHAFIEVRPPDIDNIDEDLRSHRTT